MKGWIVKYALTTGIEEAEFNRLSDDEYVYPISNPFFGLRIGRDVHLSREEAVKAAVKMRDRRISSLKKQIARLEAMTFQFDEAPK